MPAPSLRKSWDAHVGFPWIGDFRADGVLQIVNKYTYTDIYIQIIYIYILYVYIYIYIYMYIYICIHIWRAMGISKW